MPDDIFQKFHTLPQDVKNVLTSPESLEEQEALEEEYNIPLADLLMRVMVREVSFASLPTHLREHEHMEAGKADALMEELRENILGRALPYLEGRSPTVTPIATSQTVRPTLGNMAATTPQRQSTPVPPRPAAVQTRPGAYVPPAPVRQQQGSGIPPLPPRPPATPKPVMNIPPAVPKPQTAPRLPDIPRPAMPPVSLRPTVPAQTAPFLIDANDEDDIAQHEKKLAALSGAPSAVSVEQRADAFLQKQNMTFATDVLTKRFRNVVLSRLHDVRDALGTEEMLTKPAKIGGMELDQETARRVANELEQEAARIHDEMQRLPPASPPPKQHKEQAAEKPAIVPPFVREAARASTPPVLQPKQVAASTLASVAALQKQNVQQRPAPSATPKPISIPPVSHTPQPVPPPRTPAPIPQGPAPQPAIPSVRTVPVEAVLPPPARIEQTTAPRQAMAQVGKQIVHDIRHPSKPMGPIDELADMTVDDFRRLGDTLPESASKVVEKIHLLGEDSLSVRAQGIAAWRKNMINQVYLAMGRESMVTGKTIDEIIQAREYAHQPTLTSQEFALISDINRHVSS